MLRACSFILPLQKSRPNVYRIQKANCPFKADELEHYVVLNTIFVLVELNA